MKRTLIAGVWFISVWGLGGWAKVYMDLPRPLMLVPALLIAAAVWWGLGRYETWQAANRTQAQRARHPSEAPVALPLIKA
jgi:hypothetical protein